MIDAELGDRLQVVFEGVFFFSDEDPKNTSPCQVRVHLPSDLLNPTSRTVLQELDQPLIEITRLHTNSRLSIYAHMEKLRKAGNDDPDSPGRVAVRDSRSNSFRSVVTAFKASAAHLFGQAPQVRKAVDLSQSGGSVDRDFDVAVESQLQSYFDQGVPTVVDMQATPGAIKKGLELSAEYAQQYRLLAGEEPAARALMAAVNTVGKAIVEPAVEQFSDASAFGGQGREQWHFQKAQKEYLETAFSAPGVLLKEYNYHDPEFKHKSNSGVLQDLNPDEHGLTIAYLPAGKFDGGVVHIAKEALNETAFAATRDGLEKSQANAWAMLYGCPDKSLEWNRAYRFIRQELNLDAISDVDGHPLPGYILEGEASPVFTLRPSKQGANELPPAEGHITSLDQPAWIVCSPHPEHDDPIAISVDTADQAAKMLRSLALRNILLNEGASLLESAEGSDNPAAREIRSYMPRDWSAGHASSVEALEELIGTTDGEKASFFLDSFNLSASDIVLSGNWADLYTWQLDMNSESPELS
ncbi:hypothetical protein EZI54_07120 [Marinobacter halodurans]|uniref:Uncharacterized protein n=1 Tax=Marinobacter halodurans TaxID=2528979 RepID=A0ABY1ZMF6_9GAMM|nr:hypothetical protein [Marinobacter halodurans]TBW57422.1 hypothetical protein EZI54_07120 [Marinobacter halodurans]